jgi:hypothetical protein
MQKFLLTSETANLKYRARQYMPGSVLLQYFKLALGKPVSLLHHKR